MENCLVTKLKGSVDNYNLSFFDSISLRYVQIENPTESSQFMQITAAESGPVIVEALDGLTFSTSFGGESIGSIYTIGSNETRDLFVSNNAGRIIVHNKQNIKKLFSNSSGLCKDFDYATRLEYMAGRFDFSSKKTLEAIKEISLYAGSIGDLKNISPRENLINFTAPYPITLKNFSGSLEDLSGCRALELIGVNQYGTSASLSTFGGNILSIVNNPLRSINIDKNLSISGTFETLAQCLILYYNKYGNLNDVSYTVSSSALSGSVQAFVNACVDGGVTSGTITVPYFKTAAGIYSDIEHTLLIKNDSTIAASKNNNRLSWSSDKTWTVS